MKKINLFIAFMLSTVFSVHAEIYEGSCGSSLTWSLNTETGLLSFTGSGAMSYSGSAPWYDYRTSITQVSFPSWITSIASSAFENCTKLKAIEFPNNVTTINDNALKGCKSLRKVTFGEKLTSIGNCALQGCSSLDTVVWNVKKYNSETSSGNTPFYSYYDNWDIRPQIKCFIFGSNVQSIPQYLCCGMSGIKTSIVIPESVSFIGDRAFQDCTSLSAVTLNKNIKSYFMEFYGCTGLTKVYYPGTIGDWCRLEFRTVPESNPLYYAKNLYINNELVTELTIPDSITSIGEFQFAYASCRKVILPSTLSSISIRAFIYCALESVNLENTALTELSGAAFYHCENLKAVEFPNTLTTIGNYAFQHCSSLRKVTLGENFTSMGNYALDCCPSLDTIVWNVTNYTSTSNPFYSTSSSNKWDIRPQIKCFTFGPNVETIPAGLCCYMENINTPIVIPESVTSIGAQAFAACSSLPAVTLNKNIKSYFEEFDRCSRLTKVYYTGTIGDWCKLSFRKASSNPLYYAKNLYINDELVTELTIPDSITSIGEYLFYNASCIKKLTLPSTLTSIGEYAFNGCSSLRKVTFGENLTSVADQALRGCTSLDTIVWNVKNYSETTDKKTPFYYYNSAPSSVNWDIRSQIKSIIFGPNVKTIPNYLCYSMSGINTPIIIPDSVTSIGPLTFYGCSSVPALTLNKNIKSYNEQFNTFSGLTKVYYTGTIGDWCNISFSNPSSNPLYYAKNLYVNNELVTELVIPDSITSLKQYLFYNASCIEKVTLSSTLTGLPAYAFYGCTNLQAIEFPNTIATIGNYAFQQCSSLRKVTFGENLTFVANQALRGCTSLDTIVWNVKNYTETSDKRTPFYYEDNNYSNNWDIRSQIKSFTFGPKVENIPEYLCCSMENINTPIVIPDSVTSIGARAFYGCSYVPALTLNKNINYYDEQFSECSGLTKVYFTGTIGDWCGISFRDSTSNPLCYAKNLYVNNELVTELVIPDSITSLHSKQFYNASCVEKVTLPSTLTEVPTYAFYGCTNLKEIEFPNSITKIDNYAFTNCSSLRKVTFGKNLKSVANQALRGCTSLDTVVWNAKNYKETSGRGTPFYYQVTSSNVRNWDIRSQIKSFTFGPNVDTIPGHLCSYMPGITATTIPASVTCIGEYAFENSTSNKIVYNLSALDIVRGAATHGYVAYYADIVYSEIDTIDNFVFAKSVNQNYLVDYLGHNSQITLPANYRGGSYGIGYSLFRNDTTIHSITIPNAVTSIDDYAFDGCNGLTSIEIPNSVMSIGEDAFANCDNLKDIYAACGDLDRLKQLLNNDNRVKYAPLPYAITASAKNGIVRYPQNSCDALEITALPSYGYHFTQWNDGNTENPRTIVLTQDTFFSTVFAINPQITYVYDSIKGYISGNTTIPYDSIGEVTFWAEPNYGYHFTQWNDGNTDNPRTIYLTQDTTFNAEFAVDKSGRCGAFSDLTWSYNDRSKVLSISGNGALTENYTFGIEAPSQMQTLIIGSGVTAIGDSAFYGVASLNHLSIGNTVSSIGDYAFAECRHFDDITCYAVTVPTINATTFANIGNKQYIYLYVPENRERAYLRDEYWGEFDIKVLEAETVTEPVEDVSVVPSDNMVDITWPAVNGAETYEIQITKDGEVVCTLIFNQDGQLTGIAFAPSRNGQNHTQQAQVTGFKFTVTGLTSNTTYGYSITSKDESETTIDSKSGLFTTTDSENPEGFENISSDDIAPHKVMINGTIYIIRGEKVYDATGHLLL